MRRSAATRRVILAAAVLGSVAWAGVIAIGIQLASSSPRALGFDLELLLQAGRDVAAGESPYAPALIGGAAPTATELFYSYPPPVAQAMSLFAGVPSEVMLLGWAVLAMVGLLAVSEALRRRLDPGRDPMVVLAVVAAAAPLTLPFAVGLLFGNFDVFFPTLYGAMLLAALGGGRRSAVRGGIGLVLASLKLHPASMGAWFLVRGWRHPGSGALVVVAIAAILGLAIVGLSVVLGGTELWAQYAEVVRAGTGAVIVDPRNAGIAAQVSMLLGGGDALARSLHVVVALGAVALTIWAAWRRDDPLESFAWAAAASLSTLPVTWYHYPSALIPVAVAAWLRTGTDGGRRVIGVIVAADVLAVTALVALPLLWPAIGLVVLAARWSAEPGPARPAHAGG
jgi:hypothetical protein